MTRKLILILALLACGCMAATPAYVQGVCGTGTSPLAVSLGSAVAAGDELIVYAENDAAGATISVSDGLNGDYTLGAGYTYTGNGMTAAVLYRENSAAGSDTVTESAASGGVMFCAAEYSGLPATGSFDGASFVGSPDTTISSPSLTISAAAIVLSAVTTKSGASIGATTVAAPYTARVNQSHRAYVADQGVVDAGTAAGGAWTVAFGGAVIAMTAAFFTGSSPPAATVVPRQHASICCRRPRP